MSQYFLQPTEETELKKVLFEYYTMNLNNLSLDVTPEQRNDYYDGKLAEEIKGYFEQKLASGTTSFNNNHI